MKQRRLILLVGLLCFLIKDTYAQYFPFKHYTTDNGLVNSSVFCCYQDHQGFMWFGTENGVSRFDGNTFRNYTVADGLPGNIVTSITEDEKGRIYFGIKSKGIACLYKDQIFLVFSDTFAIQDNNYLNIKHDTAYTLSQKGIFINDFLRRTTKVIGAAQFNLNRFDLYSLKRLQNGQVLASISLGFYSVKHDSLQPYNLPSPINPTKIFDIFQQKNSIWLSSDGKVYNVCNTKCSELDLTKYFGNTPIDNFIVDRRGYIWAGSTNLKKVICIANGSVIDVNYLFGVKDISLTQLKEDDEGNIWICTFNEGVFYVNQFYVNILNDDYKIRQKYVTSFLDVDGKNVLMGTNNGLYALDVSSKKTKNLFQNEMSLYVRNLSYSEGTITASIPLLKRSSPNNFFYISNFDKEKILVGNKSSAIRYNDSLYLKGGWRGDIDVLNTKTSQVKTYNLINGKLNGFRINDLCVHDINQVWIATTNGLFNGVFINGALKTKQVLSDSIDCSVNHIVSLNKNEIYFCTDKALVNLKNGVWKFVRKIGATRLAGVTSVVIDGYGNTWVGTLNGLYLIHAGALRCVDLNNGMLSNQVNALLYNKLYNTVIIGTSKGLALLDVDSYNKLSHTPPKVEIIKFNSATHLYNSYNNLVFPYTERTFNIEFTGVSLSLAHQLQFQYSIDSKTWIGIPGRVLQLVDQPYGSHKVFLRCGFGDDIWSTTTELNFVIQTPYWATWWFIVAIIFIGLSLIAIIIWGRINSLRKTNIERIALNNRINELRQQALAASMNPHFVFNSLNSIQHFINAKEPHEASDYLGKFARLIRKTVDLSGDTFITLKEEVSRLEGYLELEKLRLEDMLTFDIKIKEGVDINKYIIPNMVIQPFVENAIWHGILPMRKPGKVSIYIGDEAEMISISIEDNGIGYKRGTKKQNHISKGMSIVSERLISMMPNIEVSNIIQIIDLSDEDSSVSGTRVLIRFNKETAG